MTTPTSSTTLFNTWPWMVGIHNNTEKGIINIPDAIDPVCDNDQRLSVKDLIVQHCNEIDQVRKGLINHPLYNAMKHDDLFILRFILSHKCHIKKSIKAACHTLEFRKQHQLDDHDIRYVKPEHSFASDSIQRYMKYCTNDAFRFTLPDAQWGIVAFICLDGMDTNGLAKNVPEEDWLPIFIYSSEWAFQWQDYITRTTGRLTKSIRIIDVSQVSIHNTNSENTRREGNVMGIMEDCYPQLLQSLFVCHAPIWIQIPWRMIRPLLPKRVASKIDFINPIKNEKERQRLLQYISIENLPTRYGGKNETWPVDFPLPSTVK